MTLSDPYLDLNIIKKNKRKPLESKNRRVFLLSFCIAEILRRPILMVRTGCASVYKFSTTIKTFIHSFTQEKHKMSQSVGKTSLKVKICTAASQSGASVVCVPPQLGVNSILGEVSL